MLLERDSASWFRVRLGFFLLGTLLKACLKSLPAIEGEPDGKRILESDLLQPQTLTIGATASLPSLSFNPWMEANSYSAEVKESFLDSLLLKGDRNPQTEDWLDYMYAHIKTPVKLKDAYKYTERVVIAALLRQLGVLDSALTMLFSLSDQSSIHSNLRLVWNTVYTFRRDYAHIRQSTGTDPARDRQPDICEKARFLVSAPPVTKRRMEVGRVLDQVTAGRILGELRRFLNSPVNLSQFKGIMEHRAKRLTLRQQAFEVCVEILRHPIIEVAFLSAINPILSIVTNVRDVKSVSSALLQQLVDKGNQLFIDILNRIPTEGKPARLQYLKMIAIKASDAITTATRQTAASTLLSFVGTISRVGEPALALFTGVWRLVASWIVQCHATDLINGVIAVTSTPPNISRHYAIRLLTVLCAEMETEPYDIATITSLFQDASPQIAIELLAWLSQWLLANDTPPDTVAVRGNTFLFADFVRFVVK
jgi:hypothetical protein